MATARDVFRSQAFLVGAAQSALWIALGAAFTYLAQSFEKIFKDFNCCLPAVTVAVLTLDHFLTCYWYLGVLLIVLWPLVSWGVVLVSPSPNSRQLWYVTTWTLPFVCAAVVIFALVRPLIVLIDRLQS